MQPTTGVAFVRAVALVALVALAVTSSGCSFIFVKAPPPFAKCTGSPLAPVVDTLAGSLEAVRTGIALGATDDSYKGAPISRGADIGIGVGLTALFVSSAAYGYVVTKKCNDARAHWHHPHGSDDKDDDSTPGDAPAEEPAAKPAAK